MSWVHQYLTKIMIRSVISFQWGKRVLLICLYKLATTFFNLSTWRRRIDRWVHGEGHLTKSEGFNDGKKASSKTVLTGSLKMRPHLSHILRESSGDEIKILQDTCLSNLDTTSKRDGYVQLCQLVSIVEVSSSLEVWSHNSYNLETTLPDGMATTTSTIESCQVKV